MRKIGIIVPYFGSFPPNFQLWLEGCKYNTSIEWLIFTDDKRSFSYPDNVIVKYCKFNDIKKKIQKLFDFEIALDRPYKLCDYRVAYGEIFDNEIEKYDNWGYCDVDLLFGNIRKYITDDVLNTYEKVGFQGHLTILKNNEYANGRYRTCVPNTPNYIEIFSSNCNYCFDETVFDRIYDYLKIPVYRDVHFAHLSKYSKDFFLKYMPEKENYKNRNQIFTFHKGELLRIYTVEEKVFKEEFIYIHFFCRSMAIRVNDYNNKIVIYPNVIEDLKKCITEDYINKKAHISVIKALFALAKRNWKKISVKKIINWYKEYTNQRKKENDNN